MRRDTQFKRDVKRLRKQGKEFEAFKRTIRRLANGERLPEEMRDHALKGVLKDCRECHIELGWLLIYRIEGSELCRIRTGSHTETV